MLLVPFVLPVQVGTTVEFPNRDAFRHHVYSFSPAKVFVIGAGVAGLQAIATARRLGGVVSAFDVRPAAREQVQSLGATFVEAVGQR